MGKRILIVDDEKAIRWSLGEALAAAGYTCEEAQNGHGGVKKFEEDPADCVVLDLKLPDIDGIAVLKKIREIDPDVPIVMMTAYGEIETAVEAIRAGAYDFLQKPFQLEKMKLAIRNAMESSSLRAELEDLRRKERETFGFKNFIGRSAAMESVFETIKKIGSSKATTILIQGESGTGKELVARAIHESSGGGRTPFLEINCAALPESLLESELFGHEKGAFTDAKYRKKGLFELAEGGTIFLDEIGEMGITLQSRLLRVIENKTFRRVGGVKDLRINTRIVAATNRDLTRAIAEGRFRNDLYYRLKVIPIQLAPLRERREDIVPLANHFIAIFNREFKKSVKKAGADLGRLLESYSWPGNVRELRNVIERAMLLEAQDEILPSHLPPEIVRTEPAPPAERSGATSIDALYPISIEEMEKLLIRKTLAESGGNKSQAARVLGISRQTLREKIKLYEIE